MRFPYLLLRSAQTRYTIGLVAVVIDSQGRVLIVEHVLHPRHPWGLPGGWIGHNEDPAAAISRELREELQLAVRVKSILHIAKPFRNHLDLAFLCEAQSSVGELNRELLSYKWVKPDQLPDLHLFHKKSIEIAFESLRRRPKWEQA